MSSNYKIKFILAVALFYPFSHLRANQSWENCDIGGNWAAVMMESFAKSFASHPPSDYIEKAPQPNPLKEEPSQPSYETIKESSKQENSFYSVSSTSEVVELYRLIKDETKPGIPKAGATEAYLATLSDGSLSIFKPESDHQYSNYKLEVAAYMVSRVFGNSEVPPTVEVTVNGRVGSLQTFISNAHDFIGSTGEVRNPNILLLDYLIDNNDRHWGNVIATQDGRVYAIDHGVSFGVELSSGRRSKVVLDDIKLSPDSIQKLMSVSDGDLEAIKNQIRSHWSQKGQADRGERQAREFQLRVIEAQRHFGSQR